MMGPPELTVVVSPPFPSEATFGEGAARWGVRLTNDAGSTWTLTCPRGGGIGCNACDGNSGEATFRIYPPDAMDAVSEIQVWPVTVAGGSLGYPPCKATVSGSTASITIPPDGCEAETM
ncbi:hypothetical protein [Candidatus Palauibacter sp.]|uniref:hypothetical protein n=1 Tax=Candidatus Palauibacter sp. TaxID=3101350 RepID=UPI003B5BDE23